VQTAPFKGHVPSPGLVEVLDIPVSPRDFVVPDDMKFQALPGQATLVTFVNPHACWLAEHVSDYLDCLRQFDRVLCDGIGMSCAARRFAGLDIGRSSFDLTSLAGPVFNWLRAAHVPAVLVGGEAGVAEEAGNRLGALFPGLVIGASFTGFPPGPEEATAYLLANPGTAVICGMGAPHQERFLLDLKSRGWTGMGFTCGGFFDQLIRRVDYYPRWVDRLNLRFAWRLFKEPRRLGRRYLIEYQVFLKRFLAAYFSRNRRQ